MQWACVCYKETQKSAGSHKQELEQAENTTQVANSTARLHEHAEGPHFTYISCCDPEQLDIASEMYNPASGSELHSLHSSLPESYITLQ